MLHCWLQSCYLMWILISGDEVSTDCQIFLLCPGISWLCGLKWWCSPGRREGRRGPGWWPGWARWGGWAGWLSAPSQYLEHSSNIMTNTQTINTISSTCCHQVMRRCVREMWSGQAKSFKMMFVSWSSYHIVCWVLTEFGVARWLGLDNVHNYNGLTMVISHSGANIISTNATAA